MREWVKRWPHSARATSLVKYAYPVSEVIMLQRLETEANMSCSPPCLPGHKVKICQWSTRWHCCLILGSVSIRGKECSLGLAFSILQPWTIKPRLLQNYFLKINLEKIPSPLAIRTGLVLCGGRGEWSKPLCKGGLWRRIGYSWKSGWTVLKMELTKESKNSCSQWTGLWIRPEVGCQRDKENNKIWTVHWKASYLKREQIYIDKRLSNQNY